MNRIILLIVAFITVNVNAFSGGIPDDTKRNLKTLEQLQLENILFGDNMPIFEEFNIESMEVIELEEEIDLGFDTKDYLPEGFNPLKGKNDLDIDSLEVIELEDDVELNFDTKKHLPKDFNPLAGKDDIDWEKTSVIELEEEINLGFDTKKYLPKGFNPYKGMAGKNRVVVCLY